MILSKFLLKHEYRPQPKVVESHIVSKGPIAKTTRLLGSVQAQKLFTANAGIEGTVSYIAPAGLSLKAGEIIARIQNDPIEEAYLSALKAVQIASDQYNRQILLFKSKATSRQTVEDKFTTLSAARSTLVLAKINYDKAIFVAPFDGIVGSHISPVGSRTKIGDTVVTFYNTSAFTVKFDIPSDYVKTLGNDGMVSINGQNYKIDFIQKALSTNTYTVPAHINFHCDSCISGEMLDVDLHLISKDNVIVVPKSSIFIRDKDYFAYKIKDNKIQLVQVKLGVTEKNKIEITEGIEAGDQIVLKGQHRLYPGMDVKIFEDGSNKK